MKLLEYVQDELGLPARGRMYGRVIGWTTDPDKAERLRAYAHVQAVFSGEVGQVSPGDRPDRVLGYEYSFLVDAELPF